MGDIAWVCCVGQKASGEVVMDQNEWDIDEPTIKSDLRLKLPKRQDVRPWLEQIQGPGAPARFDIEGVHQVIGRSPTAEIRVESAEVSRRHGLLNQVGLEYRVEDLESRNGIYLNGVKIHSAVLREGDVLQLGNAVFVFHEAC